MPLRASLSLLLLSAPPASAPDPPASAAPSDGLCTTTYGSHAAQPSADGATGLIVVDQSHGGLPAGSIDAWTVTGVAAGSAPIKMQAWRAVGSMKYQLVCETQATIKPGLQTIPANPPCVIQEGDVYGWRQDGVQPNKAGGIGADTMVCDPACKDPKLHPGPIPSRPFPPAPPSAQHRSHSTPG